MHELYVRPDSWSELTIVEAVDPGKTVRKGDVLVVLDARRLTETIAATEVDVALSEIALVQAKQELQVLQKSLDTDIEAFKKARERADEDLLRYIKISRPLAGSQIAT